MKIIIKSIVGSCLAYFGLSEPTSVKSPYDIQKISESHLNRRDILRFLAAVPAMPHIGASAKGLHVITTDLAVRENVARLLELGFAGHKSLSDWTSLTSGASRPMLKARSPFLAINMLAETTADKVCAKITYWKFEQAHPSVAALIPKLSDAIQPEGLARAQLKNIKDLILQNNPRERAKVMSVLADQMDDARSNLMAQHGFSRELLEGLDYRRRDFGESIDRWDVLISEESRTSVYGMFNSQQYFRGEVDEIELWHYFSEKLKEELDKRLDASTLEEIFTQIERDVSEIVRIIYEEKLTELAREKQWYGDAIGRIALGLWQKREMQKIIDGEKTKR